MAVTKIHAIKATVNKSIDYITNPEKTDGMLLVSGYNCEPMTAHLDFKMTELLAQEVKGNYQKTGGGNNKAYHLIQSFSPKDNITPEKAHEIGKKLADELTGGKHEYVISTHIDKGHIHNHVILNSVSFYDYKKFRTQPYKTAAKIRSISDRLCSENDLSVIKDNGALGYSYKEYMERKKNTSWKSEIRKKLNYLLEIETNINDFKLNAAALGVEINDSGKHIKYKAEGQQRYTRGNKLSDDDRYLIEGITSKLDLNGITQKVVIDAVKNSIIGVSSYEAFEKSMLDNYAIKMKTDRKGIHSFLLDDMDSSIVSEVALGTQYSKDFIMSVIASGENIVFDAEDKQDIVDKFKNSVRTKVEQKATVIKIDDKFIDKVTVDGILIKLPEDDTNKRIFISNINIDLDSTKEYSMTIGSAFDFYYVEEQLNPDEFEGNQLSGKFIKGENIIRSMELANHVKPVTLTINEADIVSLSQKGLSFTIPELGIERMFVERKYVNYDKLKGTCSVDLYKNWHYSFRKPDEENVLFNIEGSMLIKSLEKRENDNDHSLARRLMYVERKGKLAETKALAKCLVMLKSHNIDTIDGIENKIKELKLMSAKLRENIKAIDEKNSQYKEAAKYLITYNKYLPLKMEYEKKQRLSKKGFMNKYSSELLAFNHADESLKRLGINTNVDSEKVIALLKNKTKQVSELGDEMKEIDKKIDGWSETKEIIVSVLDKEIVKENNNDEPSI